MTRNTRVLIVDASPHLRERIRWLLLERKGLEITGEAGTSVAALALFRQTAPDAVVLDVDLPDGRGHAVLNVIKQTRPECRVVVMTMLRISICRDRCLALGADHYFDKSTEFERLPEALRPASVDSPSGRWRR